MSKVRKHRLWVCLIVGLVVMLAFHSESQASRSQMAPDGPPPGGQVVSLTLITGEVVSVTISEEGDIRPEQAGRAEDLDLTTLATGAYAGLGESELRKLDSALFDVEYLVRERFHERPSLPIILSVTDSQSIEAVTAEVARVGGTVARKFFDLSLVAAELPYDGIGSKSRALLQHRSVQRVWLDAIVRVTLSESVPLIGAPDVWDQGYTGEGVQIAILDTGIDATHPDLDDIDDDPATNDPKVLQARDFTTDGTTADLDGHGTHVAGTAAGTGEASISENPLGPHYIGVAPHAYLWNVRVLNASGSGATSWIIAGIEFAALGPDGTAATGDEADVVNMSLGNPLNDDGTGPLSSAVDWAVDQGVVVAVSAGNSGPGMHTVGSPGTARRAITVGATDDLDAMASFSSQGLTLDQRLKPDVVAPGVLIFAPCANGTGCEAGESYIEKSGTSMAAPHVSGVAALLLQAHSNWGPDQVKAALMNTALDVGAHVWEQGAGRIRAPNAVGTSLMAWPPSVSFGTLQLGDSASTTVTISNLSDVPITATISATTAVDGVASELVSVTPSPVDIGAESSADVTVSVSPIDGPTLEGWYEGRVTISSTVETISVPHLFFVDREPEIGVTPSFFNVAMERPGVATGKITITNTGAAPLSFAILEEPAPVTTAATTEPVAVKGPPLDQGGDWGSVAATLAAKVEAAGGNQVESYAALPIDAPLLDPLVEDPVGDDITPADEPKVDIVSVDGGSSAQLVALQLSFSVDTVISQTGGFIHLDTDQDPTTGLPPTALFGTSGQDIGFEFFIPLFDVQASGLVHVFDEFGFFVGSGPAALRDQSIVMLIPTSLLGDDDGSLDLTLIVGNLVRPTDWAPDPGHGTLVERDVAWLAFEPPFGLVAPGESMDVSVLFDAEDVDVGSYAANILIGNDDPDEHPVIIPVDLTVGGADLSITKTDSSDPVVVGQSLTYTIKVANSGPASSTNVILTDTLPGSVNFVSATSTSGSCSKSGGTLTCGLGDLEVGGETTTTIVVVPTATSTITNTASVAASGSPDPNTADNTATEETVVIATICGDLNGNGAVDVFDVIASLQIIVGLLDPSPTQQTVGDLDGDGDIDVFDAIITLQMIVGLIDVTECGKP